MEHFNEGGARLDVLKYTKFDSCDWAGYLWEWNNSDRIAQSSSPTMVDLPVEEHSQNGAISGTSSAFLLRVLQPRIY